MKWLRDAGAEIGMRVTCNHCGKQIFLKQTGYNSVDAAIKHRNSFYDTFEPMPNDWVIKHDLGGWVCGDCLKQYNEIIKKFNGGVTDV